MINCSSGFCNLNLTRSSIAEKNEVRIENTNKNRNKDMLWWIVSRIRDPDRFVLFLARNKTAVSTRGIDGRSTASTWGYQQYWQPQYCDYLGHMSSADGANTASTWSRSGTDGANTTFTRDYEQNWMPNTRTTWSRSNTDGLNTASTGSMSSTYPRVQAVPAVQKPKLFGVLQYWTPKYFSIRVTYSE